MPNMEKRPCVHGCGKLLDPRGAHKHEFFCEKAPKAPGGPHEYPAPLPRRRQPATKRTPKPPQAGTATDRPATGVQRAAADRARELGCDRCAGRCLQGANVPTVQFIERLIRGGLSLEAATGCAREAAVVFGGGR
jgi:hypothetical protein